MTKRKLKAKETKEKIYETALSMLENDGYDNIRIEDICEKAGVSIGSFYTYFNSKNDILGIIFKKGDDFFANYVKSHLIDPSSIENIINYFIYYSQYNVKTGVTSLKHLYTVDNPYFVTEGRDMQNVLDDHILKGQQQGEITSDYTCEYIREFLFITARGLVYNWCTHSGDYDLDVVMKDYIQQLMKLFTK